MNRAQRRAQLQKKGKPMAFEAEAHIVQVQFAHGHSAEAVVVVVRRPGRENEQFTFSPEQAEAFIAGLQQSIAGLKEMRSRPADIH